MDAPARRLVERVRRLTPEAVTEAELKGAETELEVRISQGLVNKHQNLLSISKPAEPNHYKMTASLEKRKEALAIF